MQDELENAMADLIQAMDQYETGFNGPRWMHLQTTEHLRSSYRHYKALMAKWGASDPSTKDPQSL